MEKEKALKILKKAATLETGKSVALAKEFDSIEESVQKIDKKVDGLALSVDEKLDNLSEELKKKLEQELVLDFNKEELVSEVSSGVENVLTPKIEAIQFSLEVETNRKINEAIGIVSEKHKDALLEVRQLSNKKTKIIDEKLSEVDAAISEIQSIEVKDGKDGKDGSPDTRKDIVDKINSGGKEKINASEITGLPDFTREVIREVGAFGQVETTIKAGSNITITKDATGANVISSTASGSGSQTLQDTTTLGNTTTDDIEITSAASGIILKSANGTRWRIGITNAGELTATSL